MRVPISDLERPDVLLLALADAWWASSTSGPGDPVAFWRGDLGMHRNWPDNVAAMTRTEAEDLVRDDLAHAAHPASEVMMISPTRHALDAARDFLTRSDRSGATPSETRSSTQST